MHVTLGLFEMIEMIGQSMVYTTPIFVGKNWFVASGD
jgi:hypothetical protein